MTGPVEGKEKYPKQTILCSIYIKQASQQTCGRDRKSNETIQIQVLFLFCLFVCMFDRTQTS